MTLCVSIAIGILFAAGVHLMLQGDLVRLAAGTLLLTNGAILLLVSAGLGAREAPILPVEDHERVADPLVQALALTAAVIGFGTTVLLLRVALAIERTHDSLLVRDLAAHEAAHGETAEREGEERRRGEAAST